MIDIYLLPGLDGTGTLFDNFVRSKPEWANPIPISYESAEQNSYKYLTEFAHRQIDHSRAHFILGESFSGPIATRLAHRKSEALFGLVLSATFISTPSILSRIPIPPAFLEVAISNAPHRLLAEHFLLNGVSDKALLDQIVEVTESIPAHVIAERIIETRDINVKRETAELGCPVLYLRARHDRIVPQLSGDEVTIANLEAEIVEINSPHMILQCRPAEAWDAISRNYEKHS